MEVNCTTVAYCLGAQYLKINENITSIPRYCFNLLIPGTLILMDLIFLPCKEIIVFTKSHVVIFSSKLYVALF